MHNWRPGEKDFDEKLMDIETDSNNGGWRWAASSGIDPRPLRVFDPRLQAERFDPKGISGHSPTILKQKRRLATPLTHSHFIHHFLPVTERLRFSSNSSAFPPSSLGASSLYLLRVASAAG
jgi:deoxyribodipyrimidine photolyase